MSLGQTSPDQNAASPLLYLREDELDRGVELVLAASRTLWRAAEPALAALDLGPADYRALAAVRRRDGVAVLDLAEALGVAKQSLARTLDLLENRGLIARRPCARDRRRRLVQLTPEGRAAEAAAAEALRARMAEAYRKAGPQAVAAARGFLATLHAGARP